MRVISGTAKGRKLARFSGNSIRPTSDRVREAIFSSLLSRVGHFPGKRVLDLYAGTGAMAIEALSRGADAAVLIDRSRQAEKLIRLNLESTGLQDKAVLLTGSVNELLERIAGNERPFDLVFIDPPYDRTGIERQVLDLIRFGLFHSDGIICVETSNKTELPDAIGSLHCCDRRRYGATSVSYYRTADPGDEMQ